MKIDADEFNTTFIVMKHVCFDDHNVIGYLPLGDEYFLGFAVYLGVISLFGSFFNLVCLYVFTKNPKLRSPTNILIMALNFSDFLICFFGTPLAFVSACFGYWYWDREACIVDGFVNHFLVVSSVYNLMGIAIYRYIVVIRPMLGAQFTNNKAYFSCGFSYCIGFILAILPVLGWNRYDLEGSGISCSLLWNTIDPICMSYVYINVFFVMVLPMSCMTFVYYSIVIELHRRNKRVTFGSLSSVTQANLAIEKNVFKTSLLILVSFLCCWMPTILTSIYSVIVGKDNVPPLVDALPPIITKSQGLFDSIISIIYVATNTEFRSAVYRMTRCGVSSTKETSAEESGNAEEADKRSSSV